MAWSFRRIRGYRNSWFSSSNSRSFDWWVSRGLGSWRRNGQRSASRLSRGNLRWNNRRNTHDYRTIGSRWNHWRRLRRTNRRSSRRPDWNRSNYSEFLWGNSGCHRRTSWRRVSTIVATEQDLFLEVVRAQQRDIYNPLKQYVLRASYEQREVEC